MANLAPCLTSPSLASDSTLLFSAYAFGWGFCAFALPADVVCERLGAANASPRQLLLAFELGRQRILVAVERRIDSNTGERITLAVDDF
ncbi:conserved protein of unknown function [Burkholderia multivorans]